VRGHGTYHRDLSDEFLALLLEDCWGRGATARAWCLLEPGHIYGFWDSGRARGDKEWHDLARSRCVRRRGLGFGERRGRLLGVGCLTGRGFLQVFSGYAVAGCSWTEEMKLMWGTA
jgi:hypothetical protein